MATASLRSSPASPGSPSVTDVCLAAKAASRALATMRTADKDAALLRVARALEEAGMASRMLLQVHDELVFDVATGESAALEELVRREMAGAADLAVPLDVSVGTGRSWHEAAH